MLKMIVLAPKWLKCECLLYLVPTVYKSSTCPCDDMSLLQTTVVTFMDRLPFSLIGCYVWRCDCKHASWGGEYVMSVCTEISLITMQDRSIF